jgi:hypothetical protein
MKNLNDVQNEILDSCGNGVGVLTSSAETPSVAGDGSASGVPDSVQDDAVSHYMSPKPAFPYPNLVGKPAGFYDEAGNRIDVPTNVLQEVYPPVTFEVIDYAQKLDEARSELDAARSLTTCPHDEQLDEWLKKYSGVREVAYMNEIVRLRQVVRDEEAKVRERNNCLIEAKALLQRVTRAEAVSEWFGEASALIRKVEANEQ